MCVLESKGVTCTQQKPCLYGIYLFIYVLVNCMENINKHRLVLVKYIKRQRNLSKKSKKRHQIVPIKLKKKKNYKNEKKKIVRKKVKNIVVNGQLLVPVNTTQ